MLETRCDPAVCAAQQLKERGCRETLECKSVDMNNTVHGTISPGAGFSPGLVLSRGSRTSWENGSQTQTKIMNLIFFSSCHLIRLLTTIVCSFCPTFWSHNQISLFGTILASPLLSQHKNTATIALALATNAHSANSGCGKAVDKRLNNSSLKCVRFHPFRCRDLVFRKLKTTRCQDEL